INVATKKMESKGPAPMARKSSKILQIDTEHSIIETIAQIRSSTHRSTNKSGRSTCKQQKDKVFNFPHASRMEFLNEILQTEEEKEATKIQDNFEKLQTIAGRF